MRCTVGTPAGCCRSSSCRLSQVARDDQPPTVRIRRSTHIGRRIGRLDPAIPAARNDPPPRVFGRGSCAILRDQLRDGLGDTRRFALDAPRGGARSSRVRPRCARQDARLASVSSLRVLSQRCGESTTGRTPGVFQDPRTASLCSRMPASLAVGRCRCNRAAMRKRKRTSSRPSVAGGRFERPAFGL